MAEYGYPIKVYIKIQFTQRKIYFLPYVFSLCYRNILYVGLYEWASCVRVFCVCVYVCACLIFFVYCLSVDGSAEIFYFFG